ncbi:MAG: HAD family phosphatase [Planctomycetes bacterium]|nr:HAD family phosphatase [Planctomycetota bacterium]
MPIKTVIFDFGNVLAFFDHGRSVARLKAFTKLSAAELAPVLNGCPLEDAYERGAIDTDEYVRRALAAGQLRCTKAQFLAAFVDIFWRNDEVCGMIPRLKAGYRVLLASNTNAAHFDHYSAQFADVLQHFEHLGASHHARARKPELAFCAHIQQFAHCEPCECLFIDDMAENIVAAERFGWRGLVYRPDGTLPDKLRAAGVAVGTTEGD